MLKNGFIYIISILFFWGCSKPYSDTLPTVQMLSVSPYGSEDSVVIMGNVTSNGTSTVSYIGFSYSASPNFDILSRQVLGNGNGTGSFAAVVPAIHDSTYYFKAFAANDNGYSVSNVIKYTVPAPGADSAPCTLNWNTVIFNSSNWTPSVYTGTGSFGSFYVEADFGLGYTLEIYFNKVPTNGVYGVLNVTDFLSGSGQYSATLTFDGSYSFNEGGNVYVAQEKDGTTTVSFCGLVVNMFSTNYPVSAKLNY